MHKLLQDWGALQHTLYKSFGNDGQCIIFRLVPVWCLYIQNFFMKLEWFKIWYEIECDRGKWQSCFHVYLVQKKTDLKHYICHIYSVTMYKKKTIHVIYREHNHENAPSMSSIDRFNQAKLSDSNALHNHNKPLQAD